jgi:S-adenosylmethionine:tRNA ribosyltransferase-isomerase
MKLVELKFDYPEELVATQPAAQSRVLWVDQGFSEISVDQLIERIPAGDLLILNNTKVLKRRVFAGELEILFLSQLSSSESGELWQVLFPSKKLKIGAEIELPLGRKIQLVEKGRPQVVRSSTPLTEEYFQEVAELPLPPYIQKARGERHTEKADESWYQTAWAKKAGSFAAPTASLHFSQIHLEQLRQRQVEIHELTLHVGLGTFLPVTAEDLNDHEMHEEWVQIPRTTWQAIQAAKREGRNIWALGTTVTRALESAGLGLLKETEEGLQGLTQILIQPGYQWRIVDRLLTNFHQPESTLLALVAGFSDLNTVKSAYQYAISQGFRLFSYGDLSVWIKPLNKQRSL